MGIISSSWIKLEIGLLNVHFLMLIRPWSSYLFMFNDLYESYVYYIYIYSVKDDFINYINIFYKIEKLEVQFNLYIYDVKPYAIIL